VGGGPKRSTRLQASLKDRETSDQLPAAAWKGMAA
jgi:hypothetical protein